MVVIQIKPSLVPLLRLYLVTQKLNFSLYSVIKTSCVCSHFLKLYLVLLFSGSS